MQAAEVAAEIRRMRGRKPKAPQNYEFDAALNVRPPFSSWRIGSACRHAVRCSPTGWLTGAVKNEGSALTDHSNITATQCAHLPWQLHLQQNYV
jgi:hypothetical protein